MKNQLQYDFSPIQQPLSFSSFSEMVSEHVTGIEKKEIHKHSNKAKLHSILQSLINETRDIEARVNFEEVGTVQHIGNGVATISGLSDAAIDELVRFKNNTDGLILNLHTYSLDVILLGQEEGIQGGSMVTSQNEKLCVPVGQPLVGRIINALGHPIDNQNEINSTEFRTIEQTAPEITIRAPVNTPLQTGSKLIDSLFPIGKGQRELIIGDRQTGKTSIAVDAILNQRGKNVYCIYVSIGQKKSSLLTVKNILAQNKAFEYSLIVAASPDDPPAQKYIAPFTGMTIAEYFLDQGEDVLIVFDDLTKHADAYRELSLLLRRPPGREAYPGDIFYLHARLLERACKLNSEHKGGSITALPILTTQQGNISAYIPTNLISICDGQIILDRDKFNKGFKPAVNIGISVSRVGGAAQTKIIRELANTLKLDLSQFEEVEKFARFGTDLDTTTKQLIERGRHLQQILNQQVHKPVSVSELAVVLYAATHGQLDQIHLEDIRLYEQKLFSLLKNRYKKLINDITEEQDLSPEIEAQMIDLLGQIDLELKIGEPNEG